MDYREIYLDENEMAARLFELTWKLHRICFILPSDVRLRFIELANSVNWNLAQSQFRVAHLYGIGTRGRKIKPRIRYRNETETLLWLRVSAQNTYTHFPINELFRQQFSGRNDYFASWMRADDSSNKWLISEKSQSNRTINGYEIVGTFSTDWMNARCVNRITSQWIQSVSHCVFPHKLLYVCPPGKVVIPSPLIQNCSIDWTFPSDAVYFEIDFLFYFSRFFLFWGKKTFCFLAINEVKLEMVALVRFHLLFGFTFVYL